MEAWPLRVFLAVLQTGSVSAATDTVRRTQPQISRIIRDLESELGFELFERRNKRFIPTHRGLSFAKEAQKALATLDDLDVITQQLKNDRDNVLRVIGPSYAMNGLIPIALAAMRKEWPDAEFIASHLARGDGGHWQHPPVFDVGIAILPFELSGMSVEEIGEIGIRLIAPKGDPLASKPVVSPADLAGRDFVALRSATPLRKLLDRIFETHAVEPKIVASVPDTSTACRFVAQGLGVSLIDEMVARGVYQDLIDSTRFSLPLTVKLGAIYPSERPLNPLAQIFVDCCRNILADRPPS